MLFAYMKSSQVFGSSEDARKKYTPNGHPLISKIAHVCIYWVRWVSRITLKNKKTAPLHREERRHQHKQQNKIIMASKKIQYYVYYTAFW